MKGSNGEQSLRDLIFDRFIPAFLLEKTSNDQEAALDPPAIHYGILKRFAPNLRPNHLGPIEAYYALHRDGEAERILREELRPKLAQLGLPESRLEEVLFGCLRQRRHASTQVRFAGQIARERVAQGERIRQEKERLLREPGRVISVCSDVHLGTKYAQTNDFYKWLEQREKNEKVILLGDILDFWIYSKYDKKGNLIGRVLSAWGKLWAALSKLKKRGIQIHYVPGNHDVFAFFIETADLFPWSRAILRRSPELQVLKAKTHTIRLRTVAAIHYPFFEMNVQDTRLLFTHGHYQNWGWRLQTAFNDNPMESTLFLSTAAIVFAHKHARMLRRGVKEKEWLRRAENIDDTAMAITNLVVRSLADAQQMIANDPDGVADLIDTAMSIYFGGKKRVTVDAELAVRDALLELCKMQGAKTTMHADLENIWDKTMNYLGGNAKKEQSVTIDKPNRRKPVFTPFKDFLTPDKLIFGHHHIPRDDEKKTYEVGGFVSPVSSFLDVLADGSIQRTVKE